MLTRRFVGKHVLITGAGSGFGRATARRFAEEGAETIYLVDRVEDRILVVAAELQEMGARGVPIVVDLGEIDACDRAISMALADSARLDVVVSNAAAWTDEPFLEMKDDSWLRVIAVNLTASFVLGQRAARAMVKGGGGVILFTASVSGLGASRGFAHYCVTKAGIISLVKTMAVELAPFNIRVNAVSPGPADTQQSIDLVGEETMETFRKSFPVVPMNRLASEHDIASAFLYLASDEAGYVTGHNFVVDGGLTAQVYDVPNPEPVEAPAAGV
jgi:NAD(P)-dependent dehydrogenase (short-subunit alcohol dehydrogenase family)